LRIRGAENALFGQNPCRQSIQMLHNAVFVDSRPADKSPSRAVETDSLLRIIPLKRKINT
jgi:hypothetical protein